MGRGGDPETVSLLALSSWLKVIGGGGGGGVIIVSPQSQLELDLDLGLLWNSWLHAGNTTSALVAATPTSSSFSAKMYERMVKMTTYPRALMLCCGILNVVDKYEFGAVWAEEEGPDGHGVSKWQVKMYTLS